MLPSLKIFRKLISTLKNREYMVRLRSPQDGDDKGEIEENQAVLRDANPECGEIKKWHLNPYPKTNTLSDSSIIATKSFMVVIGHTLLLDLERILRQVSQAKSIPLKSLNS